MSQAIKAILLSTKQDSLVELYLEGGQTILGNINEVDDDMVYLYQHKSDSCPHVRFHNIRLGAVIAITSYRED